MVYLVKHNGEATELANLKIFSMKIYNGEILLATSYRFTI